MGNLNRKPEIKITDKGKKHVSFQLATSEEYRNADGEKISDVQWHRIVVWGKLADIAEKQLGRGVEIAVEGRLVSRSYQDKVGNKRYITEVLATEILMLGGVHDPLNFGQDLEAFFS